MNRRAITRRNDVGRIVNPSNSRTDCQSVLQPNLAVISSRILRLPILALAGLLAMAAAAQAQVRPYIGFVYPAGGQQGTTFQVRLGGQGLDGVNDVLVTGTGVSGQGGRVPAEAEQPGDPAAARATQPS